MIGSATRALRASTRSARPFDRFVFIDVDSPSCLELESIVRYDFPEIRDRVRVVCGDANTALREYIEEVDWHRTRALVFLDPYGLEVGWDMVTRLSDTGACDVWYLFPLGGVIRMMTRDGQIPDIWRVRLDRVFGTPEWYDEFYRPSSQQSLFGEESRFLSMRQPNTWSIHSRTAEDRIPGGVECRDTQERKGGPLFALILGISNPSSAAQKAALRIANHLVKDLSQ